MLLPSPSELSSPVSAVEPPSVRVVASVAPPVLYKGAKQSLISCSVGVESQDDVRHVSERYIAKPDPFIVMVSADQAGVFQYFCKYHAPSMTGQLIVLP